MERNRGFEDSCQFLGLAIASTLPFELKLTISKKPDSSAAKELCIIALTKIYCMTHQYQTLVREITTPTLPTYVTACLNLISSKSSSKNVEAPQSLVNTIFDSFAMLVPRHTTIYRPFVTQIRLATKKYLAPTSSDDVYMSPSLKDSARRLVVILHQTVAKGGGGEEWGKSFREVVKNIHITADNVFRGVVEDWESSTGYIAEAVDVNQELSGGGRTAEDLPLWTGIDAGVERLTGLLEFLSVYFKIETSTPVTIPLGAVMDLILRMLSISIPTASESASGRGGPRLHPAIDRDEKDSLWSGLPQVYVAALELVEAISDRLEDTFLPLAQGILAQLAWVFSFGKHFQDFRYMTYNVLAKILLQTGQSLNKAQTVKLTTIVRSCCRDLQGGSSLNSSVDGAPNTSEGNGGVSNQNADTFLHRAIEAIEDQTLLETDLAVAAAALLPIFLSHVPQQYLDISIRSLIERTAILSHNKKAMLASVLNPFVGKNGNPLASIVPHLTREFGHDAVVEILLRPRMPLVPVTGVRSIIDTFNDVPEDEEMEFSADIPSTVTQQHLKSFETSSEPTATSTLTTNAAGNATNGATPTINSAAHQVPFASQVPTFTAPPTVSSTINAAIDQSHQDTAMTEEQDDSSDEGSVHLTMQLDSDSEDE